MKVISFFKLLNKKIEDLDKKVLNPFEKPLPLILIWVEKENIGTTNNINK